VTSSIQQDVFVIEVLSGDLKGTKIMTTLSERTGFDGTSNGATTIRSTIFLKTSWMVSLALAFIDDKTISKAVGDGFYDLCQYIRLQYLGPEKQLVKVDYEKSLELESEKNGNMSKPVAVKKISVSKPL
jgi:hypothetical protein